MTTQDVLTLTRLAQKYPDHREALLELIERVLTEDHENGSKPKSPTEIFVSFPLDVFHHPRNGKQYSGRLFQDGTVEINGVRKSASRALGELVGYQINGWRFWWFNDPRTGRPRPIDDLRKRGLIH